MVLMDCKLALHTGTLFAEESDDSDLDFEYPANSAQGSGFASLVSELRTAYDSLAKSKGDTVPYIVTVSPPRGSFSGVEV